MLFFVCTLSYGENMKFSPPGYDSASQLWLPNQYPPSKSSFILKETKIDWDGFIGDYVPTIIEYKIQDGSWGSFNFHIPKHNTYTLDQLIVQVCTKILNGHFDYDENKYIANNYITY